MPLAWFVDENTPFTDDQVRQYAIQAIRLGEISFSKKNNTEFPENFPHVLKSCRENALNSNPERRKLRNIEAQLSSFLKDPLVRMEAKEERKKGRTVSETEFTEEDANLSKLNRVTSLACLGKQT